MYKWIRIILIILPITYGIYFCYIKKEIEIILPQNSVTVMGYVSNYKEERISNNHYTVNVTKLNNEPVTDNSKIIITTSPATNLNYGENIIITGVIEKPKNFITNTGMEFDYQNYLRMKNVVGIMREPEIINHGGFSGNYLLKFLYKIRNKFAINLEKYLNKNDSTLSRGVILGEKTGITNSLRDNLANTSTAHIIALSGYNITIVSELVTKITAGLGLVISGALSVFSIIIFILLAGGGSSALRAGIMGIILVYARSRGKNYNAIFALLLASSILILLQPLILRYDMGFHLSVLATFGLIVFQRPIAVFLVKKRFGKFLAEILASTISASIMTMPYIAYNMGIISILGIPANIIVVPLLPILMFTSFFTGLFGGISYILTIPFAYSTHIVSSVILKTINTLGDLPYSAVYKQNIPLLFIVVVYLFLFYYAFKLLKKSS